MIVPKKQANAIADGRATQLRIPAAGRPVKVGHDYPVSYRVHRESGGRAAVRTCRVKVLAVAQRFAGDLTYEDARREGYRTTIAAKAAWVRQYDAAWIEAQEVTTCPETHTVDVDRWLTDEDLAARFDARHAAKPVQVLAFEVLADEPRFLASQHDVLSGRTADDEGHGDYTANRGRAIDDLEAIDGLMQERLSKAARELSLEQRKSFQRDLEAERARRKAERRPWVNAA